MSSTRSLVLGVVRILQPVNRYDVRRVLLAWRADTWAHALVTTLSSTRRWRCSTTSIAQLDAARESLRFHDGSAAGQVKLGYGNNWVVAAIIVTLPFVSRPVALPVLATLAIKGGDRSKPDLSRDLMDALAEQFPDRAIHVVADAAYGCGAFADLGHDMTMTTRARATAAFFELAPPRTGKRGRPRLKGDRIGTPTQIACSATWKTVTVTRYGTTATAQITDRLSLWYGTWRTDPVRVILLRDSARKTRTSGYDIALEILEVQQAWALAAA